jgi:heme oxygenase (mycobilin-producing)
MSQQIRILLYHRIPVDSSATLEKAYREISEELAGTAGLIGNELLHSLTDPGVFVVLSEWQSMAAFTSWDKGPDHKGQTSPLRPYQDQTREKPWEIFTVIDSYSYEGNDRS